MNRARIARFPHLDRVPWEKGRWSSCWNPFLKPSIGQLANSDFAISRTSRDRSS
jgi:hypothetical protein